MKKTGSFILACAVLFLFSSVTVFAAEDLPKAADAAVQEAEAVTDEAQAAAEDAAAVADDAQAAAGDSAAAEGESAGDSAGAEGESAGDSAGDGASPSGPPDFNSPSFNPGFGEKINVISSVILLPLCFLSIILWFFRAFGVTFENKNNGWLKIYKGLRKIHIPVGAATLILGMYHTIFASINHGFSVNWGSAAMVFYLLGFVCWLCRKSLKRHWVVLHRFTTLIATICMIVHCAPYLKLVITIVFPAILRKL